MKTRIITLLIAIFAIIGSASAQQYDRKVDLYKNGAVLESYDITDVDSIKFRRIDYVKAEYKVLPSGTGNVTIDGSTTTPKYVVPGTNVTYVATAKSGYKFKGWNMEGIEISTSNTLILPINSNTEITAVFQNIPNYSVTVVSSGNGTVSSSSSSVQEGGSVTLTATPNSGYVFKNWTLNGNVVSTQNPYTATVTANSVYVANFEKTYTISVSSGEGGTATASKSSVQGGGSVTLTATPNEGYSFVNWTVDGVEVSKENPYTTKITEDVEYKANFKDKCNGHAYVDLGLSVKWATCNVGATTPEGYGNYYAWGETTPQTTYDWSTYKYCNGEWNRMTKYCIDSEYGRVDNKTTLELSDDAAHVNWGGSWRMPTLAEQEELMDTNNCTWTWTTQNGVEGYKVRSRKNGNSIFLPAAGYRYNSDFYGAGYDGGYWSSSLYTIDNACAYYLSVDSSGEAWNYNLGRCRGRSVRPVFE